MRLIGKGDEYMLRAFTELYTDESTETEFSFTFYCDICNNSWKSVPVPFSGREQKVLFGAVPVRKTGRWKQEHEQAFERANQEAMMHFNRCPICKRWVCDKDFDIDDAACSICRSKMQKYAGVTGTAPNNNT